MLTDPGFVVAAYVFCVLGVIIGLDVLMNHLGVDKRVSFITHHLLLLGALVYALFNL